MIIRFIYADFPTPTYAGLPLTVFKSLAPPNDLLVLRVLLVVRTHSHCVVVGGRRGHGTAATGTGRRTTFAGGCLVPPAEFPHIEHFIAGPGIRRSRLSEPNATGR